MIADTGLLLHLRWQVVWNGFRRRPIGIQILIAVGSLWGIIAVGGLTTGLGFGAGALLHEFADVHLDWLLPGLILSVAMLLLLLTSFGTALGSLFLSSDLDLLMTAPVHRRAVFLSKLLDGIGVNYLILGVTALPALVGYGLSLHYGPLYFVLVVVALLGTPLLPEGLGALLVMLVARFAPARRVREIMGLLAALFGIGASLLGQTSRLWVRDLPRPGVGSTPDLHALRVQIESLANLPIPPLVAGRGLAAAGSSDLLGAAVGLVGFLAITFGFFALCVWLADSLYANGWVRMQSSGSATRSRQRVARDAARSGWIGRAPTYLALALKDWRVLPRDLRNFAQLLAPLILLPMVFFNLMSGGGSRRFNPLEEVGNLTEGRIDLTGVFIAIGILLPPLLLCTRISSTAISMEGKSWWLLKAAPISALDLVRGKMLASWLPFAVLSSVLMIVAALWRGFSLLGFVYGWFGVELLGTGIVAMSLGFAMIWPRIDWDDPRRMTTIGASLCSFLGMAVLGLLGGGLLCLPVLAQVAAPDLQALAWLVGILGAVLLTGGLSIAALAVGMNHLPDVGEA